jgi:hypothetical protein
MRISEDFTMIEIYVVLCLPSLIDFAQKNLFNYAVVWSEIDCRIVVVISGLLTQHHKANQRQRTTVRLNRPDLEPIMENEENDLEEDTDSISDNEGR